MENKPKDFLKYYVAPHKKVSRKVEEKDLDVVVKDSHILYNLCYTQNGIYAGAFAVSHPQTNDKDPLRFYVTKDKEIIINPIITRHTKTTVDSVEGCTTFPHNSRIVVQRWNKCEIDYQTIMEKNGKITLSNILHKCLNGIESKIAQHEQDHLDGKYVYGN